MRLSLFILLVFFLLSCGSKKNLIETYHEDTTIRNESMSRIDIDSSKVVRVEDNKEVFTEIIITEFDPVMIQDTIIALPVKKIVKKTSIGSTQMKTDKWSGLSSIESKQQENVDTVIDSQIEVEKEPYDPRWVRYLFWILFLMAIIAGVIWLKRFSNFF